MSSRLISVDRTDTLGRAAQRLRSKLSSIDQTALTGAGPPRVLRLEHAIDPVDPCAWLAAQSQDVRLYWEDRASALSLAAAGASLVLESEDHSCLAAMRAHLEGDGPRLESRFWVSARFRTAVAAASEWAGFGAVRCYLGRVEVRRTRDGCVLACHVVAGGSAEDIQTEIEAGDTALADLVEPPSTPSAPPAMLARGEDASGSDEEAWRRQVEATLTQIRAERVQKVVLARSVLHRATEPLCPVGIVQHLSHHNPETFRFCVQVAPNTAFVGASPELLYRRRGRALESEAMAGTRPRGADKARDDRLAAELRASAKETREQRLVRDHVIEHLGPLCEELEGSGHPTIHRLPNVQHLRTGFRGRLRTGVDDCEILARLHPTPAVCGMPAEAAFEEIATHEAFDRGLYGGVVGSFGIDDAECAVAIRCGLVRNRELRLFAGAGIVEGSAAASEWQETVNKLRAFTGVLASPAASRDPDAGNGATA